MSKCINWSFYQSTKIWHWLQTNLKLCCVKGKCISCNTVEYANRVTCPSKTLGRKVLFLIPTTNAFHSTLTLSVPPLCRYLHHTLIVIINYNQPFTLTKHKAWSWGSSLLLLPAAERCWCSTAPSCGPWHRGRRQPAGTTPAAPPQRQSRCMLMPCSPALGEERKGGGYMEVVRWGECANRAEKRVKEYLNKEEMGQIK